MTYLVQRSLTFEETSKGQQRRNTPEVECAVALPRPAKPRSTDYYCFGARSTGRLKHGVGIGSIDGLPAAHDTLGCCMRVEINVQTYAGNCVI